MSSGMIDGVSCLGEMVVFDNHLRGCYLTRDSVRSQAAVSQRRAGSRAGALQ